MVCDLNQGHVGEAAPGKLEVSSRIPQGRIHSSRDMQVQGQGEGGIVSGTREGLRTTLKTTRKQRFKKKAFIFRIKDANLLITRMNKTPIVSSRK